MQSMHGIRREVMILALLAIGNDRRTRGLWSAV
jgi:hypothetical protein